jgi:iron complex transport system substrate-binding protein
MMKKYLWTTVFCFMLISSLLLGCAPSAIVMDTPRSEEPSPESNGTQTAVPQDMFTIQTDEEFIQPISVLYQAFYGDDSPTFVESNGDLYVGRMDQFAGDHPNVHASFMPGAVLTAKRENEEVGKFIDFAVSLEGQKLLINSGELPGEITITDQVGNDVTIKQPVERVISSYGPTTAIVYSIGMKDLLVSASYLGARDPLGSRVMAEIDPRFSEIMGDEKFSQQEFNIEEAAKLNPDLILTSARSAWLDIASELDISLFLYDPESIERLKEAVLLTGQLFGPQSHATAQALISYFDSTVSKIQEQTSQFPQEDLPRILFTGTEPLRVVSGDMYQTQLIEAAGGISVSKELSGYWNDVNLEEVVIWDPDIILVPPYGGATVEAITESPEWQILEAVQAGRVYQMPKLVVPWDTPAPDSILGIVWLAGLFHPGLIGLDCIQEADYFYNIFYQYGIPTELASDICGYD